VASSVAMNGAVSEATAPEGLARAECAFDTDGADGGLAGLFQPRGIAYIGVPRRGRSLGGLAVAFGAARPGSAALYVVHPEMHDVHGVPCYRNLSEIPGPVDVAFIAVPARAVAQVVDDCAAAGIRYAVVASSGFAESSANGYALQTRITSVAADAGMRIIGPNCNGLWNVVDGLSLGFNTAHGLALRPGKVGVVAQTGAVLGSFLAGVDRMGGGLAFAASTGNEADVDASEVFRYLAHEPRCEAIILLLDSILKPAMFETAARNARARGVPVVAYKFGKSARGKHAAELHSARVAGGARAFSAWLRSLGVVEAPDLESTMFAAAMLGNGQRPGPGVAVVSTSGAGAAMIADLADNHRIELPDFGEKSRARLTNLFEFSTPYNPLDLAGQANDPAWLASTMDAVFEEPGFSTVVLLSTLLPDKKQGVAPVVSEFAAATTRHTRATCVYAVGPLAEEHRRDLAEVGVPVADSGATLFGGLTTVQQVAEMAAAPVQHVDPAIEVVGVHWPAAAANGGLVLHDEAKNTLAALGVPFVSEQVARTLDDVAEAASGAGPFALKLLDRNLPHKAAAGGVELGVATVADARLVAARLFERASSADARILLQVMTPSVCEIFLGTVDDPVAGPVVVVGRGGRDVETDPDVAVELAPVDSTQVRNMVAGIRPLMAELRLAAQRTGRDVDQLVSDIAEVAASVSALAASESGRVQSIDINPLVITNAGELKALDVRVELSSESSGTDRAHAHTEGTR
jgi:acetate---CoA ligase (ADP-forming)